MPRYPYWTRISLLDYLHCAICRGRKHLGLKPLRIRSRNVGQGLIVRISSSDNVEKGIAVDVVDRREGPLMASFVFVLVVIELQHHLEYVDAGNKLDAAVEILFVKLVKG